MKNFFVSLELIGKNFRMEGVELPESINNFDQDL